MTNPSAKLLVKERCVVRTLAAFCMMAFHKSHCLCTHTGRVWKWPSSCHYPRPTPSTLGVMVLKPLLIWMWYLSLRGGEDVSACDRQRWRAGFFNRHPQISLWSVPDSSCPLGLVPPGLRSCAFLSLWGVREVLICISFFTSKAPISS